MEKIEKQKRDKRGQLSIVSDVDLSTDFRQTKHNECNQKRLKIKKKYFN